MQQTQAQSIVPTRQLPATQAQRVSISDLMGSLMPGAYCLGKDLATDRLVVVSPKARIVLAVAMQGSGLSYLGYTAAATALHNRHRLVVVTERPGAWPGAEKNVNVFVPAQFRSLAQQLAGWPAGSRRTLVIIDDITLAWGLSPADVGSLAESLAVSTLVLARPGRKAQPDNPESPARAILNELPEAYMLKDGNSEARAPFLMPVYGMGGESLASVPVPSGPLEYGQFIMRHQSRWLRFATATKNEFPA
jgi:hypothetical protein